MKFKTPTLLNLKKLLSINYEIVPAVLISLVLFSLSHNLSTSLAQQGSGVALEPTFLPDPIALSYVSGGTVNAARRYGKGCRGFISHAPDHTVELLTPFDFFRLHVQSDYDTTLIVRQENSDFLLCDDDTEGINPEIRAEDWEPGRYSIYIGSYDKNIQAPYTLYLTEYKSNRSEFAVSEAALPFVSLDGDFRPDPFILQHRAGGPVIGSQQFSDLCRGYVAGKPNHVLELTQALPQLRLSVDSVDDTSLIVFDRKNNQLHCNDDTNGANPEVVIDNAPASIFEIFVGNFQEGLQTPYKLEISKDLQ